MLKDNRQEKKEKRLLLAAMKLDISIYRHLEKEKYWTHAKKVSIIDIVREEKHMHLPDRLVGGEGEKNW